MKRLGMGVPAPDAVLRDLAQRWEVHILTGYRLKDKVRVCDELNLAVFIDTRLEVLRYMEFFVPVRLLFSPTKREIQSNLATALTSGLTPVRLVRSWIEVLQNLQQLP